MIVKTQEELEAFKKIGRICAEIREAMKAGRGRKNGKIIAES